MKGRFITFEGVEGSGKSTQIRILTQFLEGQGFEVVLTREPGGTPISDKIRDLLLDVENKEMKPTTELLLYAASRSQHVEEKILPALKQGKVVICDRFADSTVAYQGFARGIDRKLIDQCILLATGGVKPDLTFVLDMPVEIGRERASRRGVDRMEQEEVEFHEKVRGAFLEIAKEEPERVIVVDADCSIDELSEKLQKIMKERMKEWH
ncbi:dTMP kinase [Bdellovibrionota bacterium]